MTNQPHRLLCFVYREDAFVGVVITSADVLRKAPFRKLPGYSVMVYRTGGPTEDDLRRLLHYGRQMLGGRG
jgi:hypothetical protein